MSVSADIWSQLFTLSPGDRFSVAQKLLDSIDDTEAEQVDEEFLAEIRRRREELLKGDSIEPDWRAALTKIERSLTQPS